MAKVLCWLGCKVVPVDRGKAKKQVRPRQDEVSFNPWNLVICVKKGFPKDCYTLTPVTRAGFLKR